VCEGVNCFKLIQESPEAGSYNEPSGSINVTEFFDQLNDYRVLKKALFHGVNLFFT
jgi:hypothetical protein